MYLAKVVGTVVSTSKNADLVGFKLLLTRRLGHTGELDSSADVCVDTIGAGVGETVIVTRGSGARYAAGREKATLDASIVGIVDTVEVDATTGAGFPTNGQG